MSSGLYLVIQCSLDDYDHDLFFLLLHSVPFSPVLPFCCLSFSPLSCRFPSRETMCLFNFLPPRRSHFISMREYARKTPSFPLSKFPLRISSKRDGIESESEQ